MKTPRPRVVAAISAATAAALVLVGCSSGTDAASDDTAVLNIGVTTISQQWDPHTEDWGAYLQPLQAAYDALIRKNADGSYSGALAESWEYESPTSLLLHIRPDVTFADGEPLDAAAVVANWDDMAGRTGPMTGLMAGWSSWEADDDMTVRLTLTTPDPSLLQVLSQNLGMMVSPAALADYDSLSEAPSGAGPFTLDVDETVANDHYTFVKNPDYWDAANTGFDEITFKVYADLSSAYNALQSGQIDASGGTADTAEQAEAAGYDVLSYISFFMGLTLQGQDTGVVPALADVRVRQAMQYAVDRDELQVTIGGGQPTTQIFPPGTLGFDEALDEAYPYDPDRARELLAEAGYADGFSIPVISTDYAFFPRYMQALQAQLAEVGITLEVNSVTNPEYQASRNNPDNPVYAWYYNPSDAGFDAQTILLPDGGFNPFHITDQEMIDLYTEAASATEVADQTAAFQALSARFVDQSYHLITNFGDAYYFVNTDVVANMQPTLNQAMPHIYGLQPTS